MDAPRIRILPPNLCDQIAAGEVVERPASVVKELCENALDAGARRIEVEIEGGGRTLCRITDDGCGMTPEETALALQRHATSKITRAEDLVDLRTMGFRGEALPSIAAVSRLTVTSRPRGALGGWRLAVEASAVGEGHAIGVAEGTQIEVRDLLFNTPARLKFLKAEQTESGHCIEAVERLALAFPEVHFRLRVGGRAVLDLPPHRSFAERVRAALGRRAPKGGELCETEGEEHGVQVHAFLGPPEESGATGRACRTFVNRRFVRDRALLHAIGMGYGELVERGRFPAAILYIELGGGTVDVNVHPQKLEVRFARPQDVQAAVRHVIAHAVAQAPWLDRKPSRPVRLYTLPPSATPPAAPTGGDDEHRRRLREAFQRYTTAPAAPPRLREGPAGLEPAGDDPAVAALAVDPAPSPSPAAAVSEQATMPGTEAGGFFHRLTYLGQLHRTYLVCEAPGELVLIDQHAAHERIAFQRLREAHQRRQVRTQRLLFPLTLELGPAELSAAETEREALAALGFEVEPFGGSTLAIKVVPQSLAERDPRAVVRDVLEELAGPGAARAAADRIDQLLSTVACHSVVRAGDVLRPEEARALIDGLDAVDFRAHCPHGRPVLLRLPAGEIERRFGRT
ncbi:MAG TPA: DNA mismatch repair endonuclease MutL [Polyangia bacterium]